MAVRTDIVGIIFMVLAGLAVTAEMVFSMVLLQLAWPYWRITAIACVLTALLVAACCRAVRAPWPERSQYKWVLLQAFFGGVYWGFSVVAVQVGADPGDVAALTSINIVVAAVLGRLFLSESFRCLHMAAVLCSMAGAVLISQPEFVFGGSGRGSGLGYACAIASGFTQGLFFISARKAAGAHVGYLFLTLVLVSVPLCAFMPCTPFAAEPGWAATLRAAPLAALGWVGVAVATTLLSAGMSAAGSVLCPAAVSATVYTAASMFFGYLVQTLFFAAAPGVVTLLGAALMLSAVTLMALASRAPPAAADGAAATGCPGHDEAAREAGAQPSDEASASNVADDTESLASFMASEFSEFSAHEDSVRLRRHAGRGEPAAPPGGVGASLNFVIGASA